MSTQYTPGEGVDVLHVHHLLGIIPSNLSLGEKLRGSLVTPILV